MEFLKMLLKNTPNDAFIPGLASNGAFKGVRFKKSSNMD
jgi:hypothetical protein